MSLFLKIESSTETTLFPLPLSDNEVVPITSDARYSIVNEQGETLRTLTLVQENGKSTLYPDLISLDNLSPSTTTKTVLSSEVIGQNVVDDYAYLLGTALLGGIAGLTFGNPFHHSRSQASQGAVKAGQSTSETITPSVQAVASTENSANPTEQAETTNKPTSPEKFPSAQLELPAEPTETPAGSSEAPAGSSEAPAEPVEAPAEPAETPAEPAETPAEPAEVPAEPVEAPAEPAEAPAEPAEAPAEPAETPAKPAETPAEPAEAPAEPAETPAEPAEVPAEPVEAPAEPAEAPAEPAEAPAEPAEAPAEPAEAPAEPAETPAEPTETPAEPAEAPAQPTEAPAEPEPVIEIQFLPITADNVINANEADGVIKIEGIVKNLAENDRLSLLIGEARYSVKLENGAFSAEVDGRTLAAHQRIFAVVERDEHQTVAQQAHDYRVKTELAEPIIHIDAIAGDDIIDESEKQGEITISGSVENANDGDEVIISCGCPVCQGVDWLSFTTTVQAGKFSLNIAGATLVEAGRNFLTVNVLTKDEFGNIAIGDAEREYEDAELPPEIPDEPVLQPNDSPKSDEEVSGVVNDTDSLPSPANVRLSGKLVLDGLSARYANPQFIESIQATLNGKTYSVGLNHQLGFTLDIPEADLLAANGQAIVFSVPPNYPSFGIRYDETGAPSRFREIATLDDQRHYQLDPHPFIQAGNVVQAQAQSSPLETGINGDFVTSLRYANQDLPYFIRSIRSAAYDNAGHLAKTAVGEAATLTYRFQEGSGNFAQFSAENQAFARDVIAKLQKYAGVTLLEVGAEQAADINFLMDMRTSTANGYARYGSTVYINGDKFQKNGKVLSGWEGYVTVAHELLHSLGAKHTHEPLVLPAIEEDRAMSLMSYKARYRQADTELRPFDLAYLHYRYGVNKSARTGDDVYRFKAFNPESSDGDLYIWDGGGVDTFDASTENASVFVNLTPGSWIYRGEQSERLIIESQKRWLTQEFFADDSLTNAAVWLDPTYTEGQAFIGYGTQIERLIGSRFDDRLEGNVANNAIYGNAGDDRIFGDAGNDYLNGGEGNDRINGDEGSDTLVGGSGADIFEFDTELDGSVDTIVDFDPSEDKLELSPAVFIDRSLIHYEQESGKLYYGEVHFATLPPNLVLTEANII